MQKKPNILFIGHLLEKQGVQIALEAIPQIAKVIPNLKLTIVGGGEYMPALKKLTKKLQISKHVLFTDWVFDRKVLEKIMLESSLGLALYKPEKEKLHNFTYYADPTKLKDYLSNGIPVILTDVPYNASEIQKRNCGLVVEYKKEEVAKAIISLLQDKKKLESFQKNSLAFASQFDWNVIFQSTSL